MAILLQIAINALLAAAVYALIAAGLSFLYSTTKIFHLAHGTAVLSAGYAFWWAWIARQWPAPVSALFSLGVTTAISLAMNEFVYEELRKRRTKGLGYLIATLALLTLGTGILLALFGAAPKTFNFETQTLSFLGANITVLQVWIMLISAVFLLLFFWITHFTKFGKAMRATADSEEVAEILGIDTKMIRRSAFVLVSLLATAAGILLGLEFNLDPNQAALLAVKGFAGAVIGGVGSLAGSILGSGIIGAAEQGVVWHLGSGWRSAVTFILLFLFLLLKPKGIFGSRRQI